MTKWREFFLANRFALLYKARTNANTLWHSSEKHFIWFPDWYEGFVFKQDGERGKEDQESKPENEPAPKADGTTAE